MGKRFSGRQKPQDDRPRITAISMPPPSFPSGRRMNIQTDRFIRTTSARHEAIVYEFFQRVWDNGDIYMGQQQGWYCVSCEEFKEERELLDNHHCPLHPNKAAEWRDEQNYFFRLSKYQSALEDSCMAIAQILFSLRAAGMRSSASSVRGCKTFSISRVQCRVGLAAARES